MSDFTEARNRLAAALQEQEVARGELAGISDRASVVDVRLADRQRIARAGDEELARLEAEHAEALEAVTKAEERAAEQRKAALAALADFAAVADPRERLGELTDEVPILLFPLRLETRFKRIDGRPQLWVRAYPDTCLVDTFEPELSAGEVQSARRHWQDVWRADGDEGLERAAWRALVAGHGSGRGRWIREHHAPLNPGDRPTGVAAGAVVLVAAADDNVSNAERLAMADFWEAVWRGGGGRAAELAQLPALAAAVGGDQRAEQLVAMTRPAGLETPPPPGAERADATVVSVVAAFPQAPDAAPRSWSRPAQVRLLPERLVCMVDSDGGRLEALGEPIPAPLQVGVDPSGPPQLIPDQGDLVFPDELQWMTDFDRAVADGLGFRIPLTEAQMDAGAARIVVAGVRLRDQPDESAKRLGELVAHHRDSRSGFSLVPQGTPTNNTEQAGSGFTRTDDADESFAFLDPSATLPDAPAPDRLDGRWLADALGVDPNVLARVSGAHGTDQVEARALNAALWPATLGYFLDSLMAPLVDDRDVEHARSFFTAYVSGRGALPAVRVGPQPYGILPAIDFSRLRAGDDADDDDLRTFLPQLLWMLRTADAQWEELATGVSSLGGPVADAALLDVLGLHPASAEYHFRYAESLDLHYNFGHLFGLAPLFWSALLAAALDGPARALLRRLGEQQGRRPEILDLYFFGRQGPLVGGIVDDRPLSESEPIRPWTDDGRNYLEWVIDAARSSLEQLRRQEGFDGRPPRTLLYLLARHALILGYAEAARRLHASAGAPQSMLDALKHEPRFVHVRSAPGSESRWAPLMRAEPSVTGDPGRTVAEVIADRLGGGGELRRLEEQIEALHRLTHVPTARLERLVAEHVDVCSYRFDAWRLGYVHRRLDLMRRRVPSGVHIGAYGWLEDVQQSTAVREPVTLTGELATIFQRPTDPPLERDTANGGYIHAPSLDHAVTAAVLRAGYVQAASESDPGALSVNLSSERVRLALEILEGTRNGQSLGALLGYRLERGLHDHHLPLELDRFILPLRKAFPLVADRLAPTRTGTEVSPDVVAARNVVDGLRLVEHVNRHPGPYPFDVALPDDATPEERSAIEDEVDRLRDLVDALGDLTLAESVHQAVQGRFDAAAAALDAASTGSYPPDPEVVRTPRPGVALTHRLALQLDPDAVAPVGATPRASAEPRLEAWLAGVLPPMAAIGCRVAWRDPRGGVEHEAVVTMADLGIRPLDALSVVAPDGAQAMSELDDRVLGHVLAAEAVPIDAAPVIHYLDRVPGLLRVFDVAAPVRRLRRLLQASRPLRPGDAVPPREATQGIEDDVALDRARVAGPVGLLGLLRDDLDAHADALAALLDPSDLRVPELLQGIDGLIATTVSLLGRAARFGVPQTGWGFALAARRDQAAALLARLGDLVVAWELRLDAFDAALAEHDALPPGAPDAERLRLLRKAEAAVSTTTAELPATLTDLRTAVLAKRSAFSDRRAALAGVVAAPPQTLSTLLASVAALLPLDAFDPAPFLLTAETEAVVVLAGDLMTTTGTVAADVRARAAAGTAALAEHDVAATQGERVAALVQGAKAVFGDEFPIIPDAGVASPQAAELANALAASTSGELTRHLTNVAHLDLPVDEWLTGIARVREHARAWEQIAVDADAFGRADLTLTPLQLPFVPQDHWLALPFPPEAKLDRERLLYTAHLPAGFDPAAPVCGLLLDEWTEHIPARAQDTGIAAHFDRPSSEPPQALLLAVPATFDGAWTWEELMGAIDDTLLLARKRAVEPVHIDGTPYARFLPATIMATMLRGVSIGLSLAVNNDIARFVEGRPDG